MKINISDINNIKIDGYANEVLSKGIVKGKYLYLSKSVYDELHLKYHPNEKIKVLSIPKPCCGQPIQRMPSVVQQLKNVTKSMGQAIMNPTLVSKDKETARKSICQSCEFLKNNRCSVCGCNYQFKVKLETWTCPKGKW
jgi:hypothetical protein